MRKVRIADFKARLSEHLRYVRRGHDLTILDRETPVARVVPWSASPGLVVRPALGHERLGALPLPAPVRLRHDPLAALREERQSHR